MILHLKDKQEKFFSFAPGDRLSFALVVVSHFVDPSVLLGVCTSRWSLFDEDDSNDSSISDVIMVMDGMIVFLQGRMLHFLKTSKEATI